MRIFLTFSTIIVAAFLTSACGKLKKSDDQKKDQETSHNAEERDTAVGMYKSEGKLLSDVEADYFVVTNNHYVCLIRKDKSKTYRDCKANLSDMLYAFDGTTIRSGDIQGKKMSEGDVPQEHRLLFKLINLAKEMNENLKKDNLAVSVVLAGSYMEFKPKQLDLLNGLKSEMNALKEFLKSLDADTLKISDYTNTMPYLKDKEFGIASGTEIDVDKMVKEIKSKSIEFVRY